MININNSPSSFSSSSTSSPSSNKTSCVLGEDPDYDCPIIGCEGFLNAWYCSLTNERKFFTCSDSSCLGRTMYARLKGWCRGCKRETLPVTTLIVELYFLITKPI